MDHNKQAVALFDKFASLYQSKYMDVSLYADGFDFFCDHIVTENPSVLELACGPGNITQYLLNKRPDLKILGTDLSPNMIDLAVVNNPTATFSVMDCREINTLKVRYDAIMCGFCLPYLSKPETEKLMSDASGLLNPGGLFFISTMEDDHSKSTFKKGSTGDEIFMHFYTAEFLETSLLDNGFSVLKKFRKSYPEKDGSITTDLILIAKKQ